MSCIRMDLKPENVNFLSCFVFLGRPAINNWFFDSLLQNENTVPMARTIEKDNHLVPKILFTSQM